MEGKKQREVARAFGLNEGTLRARYRKIGNMPKVKEVAKMLADAESALEAMPVEQQLLTRNYAAKLRAISDSIGDSAAYGAETSRHLSKMANRMAMKVNGEDELTAQDGERLKNVNALTKMANESASLAMGLLSANREAIKRMETGDSMPTVIPIELVKAPEQLQ